VKCAYGAGEFANEPRKAAQAQVAGVIPGLVRGVDAGRDRLGGRRAAHAVGDSPQEAVERKAGTHHDQHQPAGRYYMPTYAKVEKDGTAVLGYEVGNSQD
jgi:hypothetical protein